MPDMLSFSAPLAQVNVTVGDDEPVPGLPNQTLNGLRAKGLLPEDGFPIFIEPDGSVDETLLRFLLDVRTEGVSSLKSIQGYAQDIRVLKRYLGEALGKGLLNCSLDDFRQFKRRRTTGDDAVSGATWNRILAACERFYGWAHERGLIGSKPFRYKGERIDQAPVARNTFAERRVAAESRTDDERRVARDLSFSEEWRLGSRQFRRTIAWYIANRPFGVVAGMIQYGHLSHITFEGYAGTSHSGFRAEVERQQALARLGDIIELYEDHKRGVRPAGGRAPTVLAEFEFVDRALAQEGAEVVSEQRLRKMLANLAAHLYPGIYSHCFFNAETALCLERSERKDQPILANCDELVCANACRWKAHAPAISDAISEIRELKAKRGMSPTQRTILGSVLN
ncbi:MAG: site-specific integrase [Rhodospirillaceae bacterium]|nr:site-specific integrase [Rhodospirillales bacterium]